MAKNIKKSSVEFAIRETAANGVAYGLNENVTEERAAKHVEVCKEIVSFLDENKDIPPYTALAMGIAQGAPKKTEYAKGYTKFDGKKVATNYRRCVQFAKHHGTDGKTFDMVQRVVAKFINQFGGDPIKWAKALKASEPMGKDALKRENYDAVCRSLGIDPERRIESKSKETKKSDKKAA